MCSSETRRKVWSCRTVVSNSVRIVSRHVSAYGEDVTFTVKDTSGNPHRGTATTLYPIWNPKDPGIVTSLVFDAP